MNWIAWLVPIGRAERLALVGVVDRLVHAALRQPGGQRGDRDPALVEDRQELRVAAAALPHQVAGGHPDVHRSDSSWVSEASQPTFL